MANTSSAFTMKDSATSDWLGILNSVKTHLRSQCSSNAKAAYWQADHLQGRMNTVMAYLTTALTTNASSLQVQATFYLELKITK